VYPLLRTIRIIESGVAPSDLALAVYIEHRDELLSYANRFVQDPARAEDVVQEAWLRLVARSGKGEEITNTLSYLYSITRNLALDLVRRATREVVEAPDSPIWSQHSPQALSAEHVLLKRDEFRVVMEAIATLPERTQMAFRMYKLEQKTLQEIADFLDVSVSRAHQMVREGLVCATRRLFIDAG
jgi:RNA polymerase sigma-70 factor (ECF subfamily)